MYRVHTFGKPHRRATPANAVARDKKHPSKLLFDSIEQGSAGPCEGSCTFTQGGLCRRVVLVIVWFEGDAPSSFDNDACDNLVETIAKRARGPFPSHTKCNALVPSWRKEVAVLYHLLQDPYSRQG